MKSMLRLTVLVAAAGLVLGAAAAQARDEFCPMGGTPIKIDVDKDRALRWIESDRQKSAETKVEYGDVGERDWAVLTTVPSSRDIVLLVTEKFLFFGAGERDVRELRDRDHDKYFGNNLRSLKETVKRTLSDLDRAGAVRLSGGEVQDMSDAAGLGILEKSGRSWELKAESCEAKTLDASDLK